MVTEWADSLPSTAILSNAIDQIYTIPDKGSAPHNTEQGKKTGDY